MVIRDNDIEYILKKMNISYADAEKALRKSKGDLNKAIRYLNKKKNSIFRRMFSKLKDIIVDMLKYKLIIIRKNETLMNLPIMVILIFLLFLRMRYIYLSFIDLLFVLLIIIITDCKVIIQKNNANSHDSNVVKPTNTPKESDDIISTLEVTEDEDYNEVNIEN
ncbi:hypothetical protein SH1V18_35290 [Vallitalea longa]|uniref:Nascent polypeptide-associated complex subunit alpha-like UBA domain-containing protein n=1 Tax=Vallitalea longa TaxID=2936439 RepID=A0A9W5YDI0_9FIRM|nr:huntingtin-interacting protein K [Vallitalea longa]GKX31049.1 hypothetical protein SH1V18_35290 [Vallitalea longa]